MLAGVTVLASPVDFASTEVAVLGDGVEENEDVAVLSADDDDVLVCVISVMVLAVTGTVVSTTVTLDCGVTVPVDPAVVVVSSPAEVNNAAVPEVVVASVDEVVIAELPLAEVEAASDDDVLLEDVVTSEPDNVALTVDVLAGTGEEELLIITSVVEALDVEWYVVDAVASVVCLSVTALNGFVVALAWVELVTLKAPSACDVVNTLEDGVVAVVSSLVMLPVVAPDVMLAVVSGDEMLLVVAADVMLPAVAADVIPDVMLAVVSVDAMLPVVAPEVMLLDVTEVVSVSVGGDDAAVAEVTEPVAPAASDAEMVVMALDVAVVAVASVGEDAAAADEVAVTTLAVSATPGVPDGGIVVSPAIAVAAAAEVVDEASGTELSVGLATSLIVGEAMVVAAEKMKEKFCLL